MKVSVCVGTLVHYEQTVRDPPASGAQLKVSWAYCTVSSSMSVTVV